MLKKLLIRYQATCDQCKKKSDGLCMGRDTSRKLMRSKGWLISNVFGDNWFHFCSWDCYNLTKYGTKTPPKNKKK